MEIKEFLKPYNPWIEKGEEGLIAPDFKRPVFYDLIKDIEELHQIISITGPRRVGKSTLLRQIIRHYLQQEVSPNLLIYYSLDDPALFRPEINRDQFMEQLMLEVIERSQEGQVHLFLDEVQRLDRWELYLKKYYDLNYPVRLVISGSAASPIFKKSQESLLGRVKDYHLLPFSFREYLLHQAHKQQATILRNELLEVYQDGIKLRGMFAGHPEHMNLKEAVPRHLSKELWWFMEQHFEHYIREGGFPETWVMPTWEQKIEYLYDNQINKVIYEDLVLAAEFRKPEQLKRFYISLLEKPGREVNLSQMAKESGVQVQQAEKYLPLLEMTDLVAHVEKFRKSPLRIRRGNIKFYLMDLALRNAVLRLGDMEISHPQLLGTYAENLVHNALKKWKGIVAIDYYRERDMEVDFVVHLGPNRYLPLEVKFREHISDADLRPLKTVRKKLKAGTSLLVSKKPEDFGQISENIFAIPLKHFLLMFD